MSEAHDALYSDPKSKEERLGELVDPMKARIDAVIHLTEVQILIRLAQMNPDLKIPRIKVVREITGWDLVTAKSLVDRFFTTVDPEAMVKRDCCDVLSTLSLYCDGTSGSKTFVPQINRAQEEKIRRLEDEVRFLAREVDLIKEDRDRYKNSYSALQDRCEAEANQREGEEAARRKVESEMATQRAQVLEAEHNRHEVQYRMVQEAVQYIQRVYKVPAEVTALITTVLG